MRAGVRTAAACAADIPDGATIAITGSGGGLNEPDAILAAIEERFFATGHPRDLTLVHALGVGDGKSRGVNRFAHEGMVRRVIGGHWAWSPRMQALARNDLIEAYTLPAGVISILLREIGAGRPGLFTHVGLGTFADPRNGGGAVNARATEPLAELLTIDGREVIRYKPFKVDVGIVRGSIADEAGNLSTIHEAADIDALTVALAARNSGGMVLAQAREIVPRGTLPGRRVTIPGVLVDAIVAAPDQPQTYLPAFERAISGEVPAADGYGVAPADEPQPMSLRKIIARRAADELRPGLSVNFGFGIPGGIPAAIHERGLDPGMWITVEQGIHNGQLLDGDLFGAARYPEAIVSSVTQFDFYSGGGVDLAFLGMGEMDGAGNVNVSRLGDRVVGPGGFVDISQNAKKVVFCGSFDAKGVAYEFPGGSLRIVRHGEVPKLVERVGEVTFSGDYARRNGREVVYITERAVFRLDQDGVVLTEIAPGVDLEADVLARMRFRPLIKEPPKPMAAAHFVAR